MYDMADIVQDELQKKRIRAKVTYPPTSNFSKYSLEFNTSVPKKKVMKTLEDVYGYTVHESNELEEGGVPARFGLSNSEKMKLAKDFDKLASDRTTSPNEKIYYKNTAKYFMDNMPDKAFNDMMGGAPEHIGGTIGRRTSAIIGKDKAKKVTGYREEFKEENCPKCDDDPCKCENITEKQGDNMNEAPRQLEDPKKETMVMKVKDANSIMVIDKKDLKKYTSKGYIQVESNEEDLDEGKYTLPITHVIVDTRTNKVTHASSDDKGLKLDVGRKSHLKIVKLKKPTTQKKTGYLLGEPLKAWGEEVELDEKEIRHDGKGPIKMSKREYDKINKFQKG